jgi:hypothetical protein
VTAQHDQPTVLVGRDLAQIDLGSHELAVVERLGLGVAARDGARTGLITSRSRSVMAALRSTVGGAEAASGMSSANWNPYQADLVLANSTDQAILASRAPVSSRMIRPSALTP